MIVYGEFDSNQAIEQLESKYRKQISAGHYEWAQWTLRKIGEYKEKEKYERDKFKVREAAK